jgi:hypothetical protein
MIDLEVLECDSTKWISEVGWKKVHEDFIGTSLLRLPLVAFGGASASCIFPC